MKKFTFKEAKKRYNDIKASDKLKMEVNDMFKKNKYFGKVIVATVASAVICFTVVLNANPTFATSLANNKFMRPIVTLLTANRFEVHENNFEAKIVTPEIVGLSDKEIEEKINSEIKNMTNELIKNFEETSNELKEVDADAHLGIESDYIIKTDNDEVISIDIYVVNTVASSSTIHKFYNINKLTGEVITLKDNFMNDENYLENISKYIENEMKKQNDENEYDLYFANYEEIYNLVSEKQSFYINEAGNVVIVFDKYEVGPGSTGCPEFEINL